MSPRAACRLETLGFFDVYDYAAGKVDWRAHNLAAEGGDAEPPTAGRAARDDAVRCALEDRVGEVRARIADSPYGFALVVAPGSVLLGRLRGSALDCNPALPVEEVMEVRPFDRSPPHRGQRPGEATGGSKPPLGARHRPRGTPARRRQPRGPRASVTTPQLWASRAMCSATGGASSSWRKCLAATVDLVQPGGEAGPLAVPSQLESRVFRSPDDLHGVGPIAQDAVVQRLFLGGALEASHDPQERAAAVALPKEVDIGVELLVPTKLGDDHACHEAPST